MTLSRKHDAHSEPAQVVGSMGVTRNEVVSSIAHTWVKE